MNFILFNQSGLSITKIDCFLMILFMFTPIRGCGVIRAPYLGGCRGYAILPPFGGASTHSMSLLLYDYVVMGTACWLHTEQASSFGFSVGNFPEKTLIFNCW